MFLLSRPPILRWIAATALLCVALWADLRPVATSDHPFLTHDLEAGEPITPADVEMVAVPPGLLDPVELPATAARALRGGDPLLATDLTVVSVDVPDGWLVVELAVPAGARPGSEVVAIVSEFDVDRPTAHEGLVLTTGADDGLGGELASCAFPPEDAAVVAVAAAENRISVLIGG